MNNRIDELEMKMDRCKHGRIWPCLYCRSEDYDRRHRALLSGAIGFALFSFALFLFAVSCRGAVNDRFLSALAMVESSNRISAVGDGGRARGAFQFHQAAWQDVSALRLLQGTNFYRYDQATNYAVALEYAREYCGWLQAQLTVALNRLPTASEIYAAYNVGLTGFERRRYRLPICPKSTRDAAKRLQAML